MHEYIPDILINNNFRLYQTICIFPDISDDHNGEILTQVTAQCTVIETS